MLTALVIDDSRASADALCQLLSFLDIQTQPCYGSRAALIAFPQTHPDLIFVDINMPGLSGFEVIAYIRREPHLRNVPVIVVTSDDQPETYRNAIKEGAMDLIVKPASLDAIEATLKKAHII